MQDLASKETKTTLDTVSLDRISDLSREGVVKHNSGASLKLFADSNSNTMSIVLMRKVRSFILMSKYTIIRRLTFYFYTKWEKLT